MTPRLTKRSTHHELTLRCLDLVLDESARSSTVRNSPRPRIVVFVTLTSLTLNVLPLKMNKLPSSSLQTMFFQSCWPLRQPVRRSARPILLPMSSHRTLSTPAQSRAADAAHFRTPVDSNRSPKICAVTCVCSPMGKITRLPVTPPIVRLLLFHLPLLQAVATVVATAVLPHMSVHQPFITFVVFKVAPVVRPTLSTATTPCAVIDAPAPMVDSTLLFAMLLTMI